MDFTIKYKANGYKAKGYIQTYEIDYQETYEFVGRK